MSNMIYKKINYISWKTEAQRIVLDDESMLELINKVKATRSIAQSNTKREDFTNDTYKIDIKGDHAYLYMYEDNQYRIYVNNMMDDNKNEISNKAKADLLFDLEFRKDNGISIRKAFGFTDKKFKQCIPRQFYYINDKFINKEVIASSIDASSQYPSGCLGLLPDAHTAVELCGVHKPTVEYPFAFYIKSGHIAQYNAFDSHEWLLSKYWKNLFRFDNKEDYPFKPCKDEDEITVLMKASDYTMDSVWQRLYENKQLYPEGSPEYNNAKLILNSCIGKWHRKDKGKKDGYSYDDHGSYQLAHIVAVAIARGNQKILDKCEEIGNMAILHICVDGIIYLGDEIYGTEKGLGKFSQEFNGAKFIMRGINQYIATKDNNCVKFKHAGFDLLDGKPIDESQNFTKEDLYKLESKQHVGDILYGKKERQ